MSYYQPKLETIRHRLATEELTEAERGELDAQARRYEAVIRDVDAAPEPTDEQRAVAVRVLGPGMRRRAENRVLALETFVSPAPITG